MCTLNLPDIKAGGHCDPYVSVRCNNTKKKTKTLSNQKNPRWQTGNTWKWQNVLPEFEQLQVP